MHECMVSFVGWLMCWRIFVERSLEHDERLLHEIMDDFEVKIFILLRRRKWDATT